MTDFNQGVVMGATTYHDPAQQLQALDKANLARSTVRELKSRLVAGAVIGSPAWHGSLLLAARVLVDETDSIGFMRIHLFLGAIPRMGETNVRRLLTRMQIWPLRRVDQLTDRQRRAIADELEALAGRGPARR